MNPNDFVMIAETSGVAIPGCKYIYAPAGQAHNIIYAEGVSG